ncbi:MAG: tetratricopeptide repeat protein [Ignavibacteriota bacterium]
MPRSIPERCRLSTTLIFLVFCRGLLPAQITESEASQHFLAGRKAQASGDLNLAAQEYLAVIRMQPEMAEARVNLGLVYYLQARYEDSARALEKALSMKPGLRGADLFLGIDYVKLGQPRHAIPCLKRAAVQEPNNRQARTWLGTALWDAGEEKEAIVELREAGKTFPADPDILFLLGQAYRNAGNQEMERVLSDVGTPLYHQAYGDIYREEQAWKQAFGHYRRALEKDPQWVGAHLGLGEAWLQQGKLDQAQSEFQIARGVGSIGASATAPLQGRPKEVPSEFQAERGPASIGASATARLAEIALLQGQPQDALRLLDEAIRQEPEAAADALGLPPLSFAADAPEGEGYRKSADVLQTMPSSPARNLALAVVDLRLGRVTESAHEWQRYRALAPAPAPAGSDYGDALREFERHDFAAARSHLLAFLATHPQDAQAHYLLARTNRALSLSVLADMLTATPDSPRTHQLMAQTLAERNENEKALAEYRKVEGALPTLGGVHFAIGELLWKMEQTDAAMAEFQQELRLNPAYAEASAAAGTILVSQHEADRAIPFLEKALQLKPGLLLAHQELGKALYQRQEFARADRELRKALADDPEGTIHYLLGTVDKQLGRDADANAAFAESRRIKAERLNAVNAEKAEK